MPSFSRTPSDRLLHLVADHGGAFSRQDALACGHSDHDLQAWTRAGAVVQATRGGYYRAPELEPAWASASAVEMSTEHERRRIAAVLRAVPDSFVASHSSALLRHELPRLPSPDPRAEVWLMATGARRFVRRAGVHMSKPIVGCLVDHPQRVVSVADAIAQTACLEGQLAALVPADAAVHDERLDLADLDAACRRMAGRHGCAALRGLVALVDGRRESPGETYLAMVLRDAGIVVTPQVWVGDERGPFARVDFMIDGTRVVLEFDGIGKYDDAAVTRAEKQREHRLHRAGYVVVRVMWADFADVPALIRRVRATIVSAG